MTHDSTQVAYSILNEERMPSPEQSIIKECSVADETIIWHQITTSHTDSKLDAENPDGHKYTGEKIIVHLPSQAVDRSYHRDRRFTYLLASALVAVGSLLLITGIFFVTLKRGEKFEQYNYSYDRATQKPASLFTKVNGDPVQVTSRETLASTTIFPTEPRTTYLPYPSIAHFDPSEKRESNDDPDYIQGAAQGTSCSMAKSMQSRPPFPGKKGVCMLLREEGDPLELWQRNLPIVEALKPYWNYSWGHKKIDKQPEDMEFVPMLWGKWSVAEALAEIMESGKALRILGFNEPDRQEQANMKVEDAINFWPMFEETGMPLISPSCASPGGSWMLEFMSQVEAKCLRVNYIGVHWYGGTSVSAFQIKMKEYYELFQRPLVITEFAPADWQAKTPEENRFSRQSVLDFMKAVLPWMEAQPWIYGYAWFSFKEESAAGTCSALFDRHGNLNALGRYYSSVQTSNPYGDQSITV